jgi:hypothetical protein
VGGVGAPADDGQDVVRGRDEGGVGEDAPRVRVDRIRCACAQAGQGIGPRSKGHSPQEGEQGQSNGKGDDQTALLQVV